MEVRSSDAGKVHRLARIRPLNDRPRGLISWRGRAGRGKGAYLANRRTIDEWNQMYAERDVASMPWYYPALDPDLAAALDRHGISGGSAVDLGTGPGTQAIALAERGFDVVGTDVARLAVERGNELARKRGLPARFVEDDVRDSKLSGPFDLIFDRGCLHVLPPDRWEGYARTVSRLLAPQCWLFLKCFSAKEPRETIPHRFTPAEIESIFSAGFDVLSIDETEYQGVKTPTPKALFCVLRKRVGEAPGQ